jgi:hypothetical protein
MAAEHDVLRGLLGLRAAPADWVELRAAMTAVTARPSKQSESVLRALLRPEFTVRLHEGAESPHAMSPADMLRSHAVQALARWNRTRHRDVIRRVARTTTSDLLAAVVRASLK